MKWVQIEAIAAVCTLFLLEDWEGMFKHTEDNTRPEEWMEVRLEVPQELAEPVSTVLAEYIQTGVVIESIRVENDEIGGAVNRGNLRVYGYLPLDDQLDDRQEEIRKALWYLSKIKAFPEPSFKIIRNEDWSTAWRKNYHPILVGEKLLVVPAWISLPRSERIQVVMDPGMAFGSGTHPTTQLCLELIEQFLEEQSGCPITFLDIGCGSGILSIAAAKLGVDPVYGVDIDPESVQIARENAGINRVSDLVTFQVGSVKDVLAGDLPARQFSLVAINMIAHLLNKMIDQGLSNLVAPGGELIISGMLVDQALQVRERLLGEGFRIQSVRQEGDWVAYRAAR